MKIFKEKLFGHSILNLVKWIIETKGREDIEVKLKDNCAIRWCSSATELTRENWNYLKVPQKEFEQLHPETFEELLAAFNPTVLY